MDIYIDKYLSDDEVRKLERNYFSDENIAKGIVTLEIIRDLMNWKMYYNTCKK